MLRETARRMAHRPSPAAGCRIPVTSAVSHPLPYLIIAALYLVIPTLYLVTPALYFVTRHSISSPGALFRHPGAGRGPSPVHPQRPCAQELS